MEEDSVPMVNPAKGKGSDSEAGEKSEGLQRTIGFVGCLSMLVGTIIGSGIFASPSSVSNYVGSTGASLVVWAGCGVIAMFASLSYCELGTMFPDASGGTLRFCPSVLYPVDPNLQSYICRAHFVFLDEYFRFDDRS